MDRRALRCIQFVVILFLYFLFLFTNLCSYPSCSGARAPGLAADMHFRDDVIAFIGPACAFALEPVARLAAYWNTPIITGMGDQVGILCIFFGDMKYVFNRFIV